MSYLHYLLLNSNIAAHVHSLCHRYTINTVHTAHILFHTVYTLFIYILLPYIYKYFSAFLHFWFDAKLHFSTCTLCNENKVESNLI